MIGTSLFRSTREKVLSAMESCVFPGSLSSQTFNPYCCIGFNDCIPEVFWQFALFPTTDKEFVELAV